MESWRKSAVLVLKPDHTIFAQDNLNGKHVSEFLYEYLSGDFNENPFASYKLTGMTIDLIACNQDVTSRTFWTNIGPMMEFLCIENCKLISYTSLSFARLVVKNLPNLREIIISGVITEQQSAESETNTRPIGRSHYNLQKITIINSDIDLTDVFAKCKYVTVINIPTVFGVI